MQNLNNSSWAIEELSKANFGDKRLDNRFLKVASAQALKPQSSINAANADCTGAGSFRLSFILADWFRDNMWKEYFYYRWDNTSNIQVGDKTGIETLLIGTGSQITTAPFALSTSTVPPLTPVTGNTQTRPSINTNNYLDSTENANGDLVFDATNTVRSSNYNDQTFIIAP